MPQNCEHSRTLAFTQVAHAFGAHSQSHGTLLPRRSAAHRGRAWSPLRTFRCQFHLPCQTPELLGARRSQMRGVDAERPRSLRTALAAPHPKKKMSKTCSISCLCNHVFAVAYHVACRHFGSGRHIAETLESSGILSPAVSPALRSCQAWRAIHQPLRSWHPGALVIQLKLLQFVFQNRNLYMGTKVMKEKQLILSSLLV